MAGLQCVLVLVLLFFQAASLQVVVRDGADDGQSKDFKAHDIRVECPKNCMDKVS